MQIPDPKFKKREKVWVRVSGESYEADILSRLYSPDFNIWVYQATELELWFEEKDVSPRLDLILNDEPTEPDLKKDGT